MQVMNKLVRDRIPEILEAEGIPFEHTVVSGQDYMKALHAKLEEEVKEVTEASKIGGTETVLELVDIVEVVAALVDAYGVSEDEFVDLFEKKRQERGEFKQGIKLLWVGEKDGR